MAEEIKEINEVDEIELSAEMRTISYKTIGQTQDLLEEKTELIKEDLVSKVSSLLTDLNEAMERGRIRAYEDLLLINNYLKSIFTAVENDDLKNLEKEVDDLETGFERMKLRHWYVVNT